MSYPFTSIWINGRSVSLENIVQKNATPRSPFEDSTFSFIREWLSDQQNFTLQTSGSTGEPKTILITRSQLIASARLTQESLQLRKFYDALICIDTKYIGGKMMLVRSFVTGMRIVAVDPCACPLHQIPVDLCVNFAAFVPYQIKSTLESKHPHLLNNLDIAIIGGAPMDGKTIEQLELYLCRCYATYGMTETISHIALQRLNGISKQKYFQTLTGITVKVDDRSCLVIEAPYLPEKVTTNDIAEILTPTTFRWLGRWDNVINTAGVKVFPEKIEAALEKIFKRLNIENRFFIHGQKDHKLGTKVTLIIEGSESLRPQVEAAVAELGQSISPYEIPKEIHFVPTFVLTETGKVSRPKTLGAVAHSNT